MRKRCLCPPALYALLSMGLAGLAHSQIITTVAGGSPATSLPTVMPALQAPMKNPAALAVDSQLNFYVADPDLGLVMRVSPRGVLTVMAGTGKKDFSGDSGPATSATLNSPGGVVVDAVGNLYIADTMNNRVRMVAPNGTIRTVAGTGGIAAPAAPNGDGGAATSAYVEPEKVCVDTAGNLFVLEDSDIRKVTANGTISTLVKGRSFLTALAVDTAGNVYFAEREQRRVYKAAPDGTVTAVAGTGAAGTSGDGGPAIAASLIMPVDVAVDAAGSVYIADIGNPRILDELVADLAFGIVTLRSQAARKQAEQANTLLTFALDNTRDAALLTDDEGHFQYVNEEACRVLGYTRADLLGMAVPDIDLEIPAERWPERWIELKAQRTLSFESRCRTRHGRIFPVEISVTYFEHRGRPYCLAFARDITERKRADEKIRNRRRSCVKSWISRRN